MCELKKISKAFFFFVFAILTIDCSALTFIPTCDVSSLYDNAGGMSLDITNGYEQSYSGMYCSHVLWMTYDEFVARNAQSAANLWIGTIDWTHYKAAFEAGFYSIFVIGSIALAVSLLTKSISATGGSSDRG